MSFTEHAPLACIPPGDPDATALQVSRTGQAQLSVVTCSLRGLAEIEVSATKRLETIRVFTLPLRASPGLSGQTLAESATWMEESKIVFCETLNLGQRDSKRIAQG